MWRRRLGLIIVNAAMFVLLAEVAAVAIYYAANGRLFYTHRKAYPLIAETAQGRLTADALHPYFGPIHKPGVRPETNNIGFGSPHPFPFIRTSNRQFLVGIFGGSVARLFCDRGAPRLIATLKQRPVFTGRDIIPLCFSHEGYKQPQQLIVLAYFLSLGQQLDLAINIDGFNEVALGTYNNDRGRDISMPSPIHLDPLIGLIDRSTMTPAMVSSLAAINEYKERLNALAVTMRRNRIASIGFVLERYYTVTSNSYQAELARFAALPPNPPLSSIIQLTPAVRRRDTATLYGDIAEEWVNASLLMKDMLEARGVRYVHVLQPNQYFTKRHFSDAEARIALNNDTPFKATVEYGYPALVRAAAGFRQKEHFFDATAVFDAEPAAVYEDDCCHYTARGNEILADFIAAKIVEIFPPAGRAGVH
jgi:hypothetical protein